MDASFFKENILPCYNVMMAVAMKIVGNMDDARDIVQDTMKHLWEHREKIAAPDSPKSFCSVAARNAAISSVRQSNKIPHNTINENYGYNNIIDEDTPDTENEILLQQAIGLLDNRKRTAVIMSLAGSSNAEIGSKLNITEPNVRQLLCRARAQLKIQIIKLSKL